MSLASIELVCDIVDATVLSAIDCGGDKCKTAIPGLATRSEIFFFFFSFLHELLHTAARLHEKPISSRVAWSDH